MRRRVRHWRGADLDPVALATALVQAALRVLGEEETGDLG